MNKARQLRILTAACCLLLNTQVFGEQLNLGEGLSIERPDTPAISYETIPSYNSSKKVLQRHGADKLQYFINIDRLPRGTTEAEIYFDRLLRDITDASVENSLKIIDQGQYWTLANVRGSYVEYVFTPVASKRAQHQIAHFLTNTYRNYIAIAVLLDAESEQQMRDDSIAFFNSAAISTTNSLTQTTEGATR